MCSIGLIRLALMLHRKTEEREMPANKPDDINSNVNPSISLPVFEAIKSA
jgi:hypothetical protein